MQFQYASESEARSDELDAQLELTNDSVYCPAVQDAYFYWDVSKPGEYAVSCVHVTDLVQAGQNISDVYITKECKQNGNWSQTDYSECLDYIVRNFDQTNLRTAWILLCIYVFGGITSLVCSALSLFLFLFLQGILSSRNMLHAHLIASYTFKHLIVLIRIQPYVYNIGNRPDPAKQFVIGFLRNLEDKPFSEEEFFQSTPPANFTSPIPHLSSPELSTLQNSNEILCKLLTALMHYMFMCNIFWMFLEGWFLHRRVVTCTFDRHTPIRRYCCVGWGLPIVIVSVWVVATAYHNPHESCYYYDTSTSLSWIMEGPIAAALLANLLFLLNIIRILVTKLHAIYSVEVNRIRKAARSIAVLLPLLGVSQLLLTYNPSTKTNENGYRIANALFQSTQGILVAIIYCFANPEVHTAMRNRWLRFQARRTCYKISQNKRSQQGRQATARNKQSSSIFEENKQVAPKYTLSSRLRYLFVALQASGSNSAASCDVPHKDNIVACPCYYHRNVIGPHSV